MKKTLVTILAAAAVVASSYGQGTVNFVNTATTLVRQQTSPINSTLITTPVSGAKVELLWAPVGTTDVLLFQSAGATANISPLAGRFAGGTRTIPAGTGMTGIAPGAVVALVVRGWTGPSATFAGAGPLDQVGYSTIFVVDSADPNPPAGIPTLITVGSPGFNGLNMAYVPEPSSMALAGLGAASLLIFRRRK